MAKKKTSSAWALLKKLGPGFITGAADDDPSGIGTYSQTGAQFGYSQLWTALFSFPLMTIVQEMCGRIGTVTGDGLAGVIKKHYPKNILYCAIVLLLIANIVNIGADLGAMASAAQLLIPIPFSLLLFVIAILSLFLEVFVSYPRYSRLLKYLTLSLFAYVGVTFISHVDWLSVAYATSVPQLSLSKDYVLNIVAILGTTISPYLFFWEADQEVEEEVASGKLKAAGVGKPRINKKDIRNMRWDTVIGMFFSNMIMFFIIVTAATTLHQHGITEITSATQAAQALQPLAGQGTFILFALGIIGTGLLAVPVLAGSASYAVSETFGWKGSLSLKLKQAPGFYGVIALATVIGLLVNYIGIPPFQMLYYTAVLNGVMAPPLIILILLVSNNKSIMGKYTNSRISNIVGWFLAIVMIAACVLLFVL